MGRRTHHEFPFESPGDVTREPRWPPLIAVLAVGGLYLALPSYLTIGPRWLYPVVVLALVVPTTLSHHAGWVGMNRVLGVIVSAVLTAELVLSLWLLVRALPAQREPPILLLRSASALWSTNVLVFALWYWRLDAGGPHARDAIPGHTSGSFLFPQMTLPPRAGEPLWSPAFIDYLFLAFNTSTAFSPTDTPILTRWAKALMMIQSLISLTVLALLAARAVNTL
jgi:hypothetical protein